MKKILFLFMLALSIASCQGPTGPEGPQGYGTNWKVINLVAAASEWVAYTDDNGQNRYYSCHFSMPEITSTVFNDGSVIGYYLTSSNSVQQPLPFVLHIQNTDGSLWTRTIDFDYSVGGLNVYVTNSNFANIFPGDMNFRVTLMW
jgi:hypothetical protein